MIHCSHEPNRISRLTVLDFNQKYLSVPDR
jgi:hypothetical protein